MLVVIGASLTDGKKRCGVAVYVAALEIGVISTQSRVPWRLKCRFPVCVVSKHTGNGRSVLILDASTNSDKSRDDDEPEDAEFDTREEVTEPGATPAGDRMNETSKSGSQEGNTSNLTIDRRGSRV